MSHEINIIDDLGAPFHSCTQNEEFRPYDNEDNLLNQADPCPYH